MGMAARAVPVVALVVLSAGCGAERAATDPVPASSRSADTVVSTPSLRVRLSRPGDDAGVPNPGSGDADPRLVAALLTRFQADGSAAPAAVPDVPGAAVRFPVRDRGSLFFGFRQISSPFAGAASCRKRAAGMWVVLAGDFTTTPGVQLAISKLSSPRPSLGPDARTPQESLTFSEAIITGPPQVLGLLDDERAPGDCSRMTGGNGAAGRVEPLPAAPVGDRSWAYRIVDATGYVWHWVQVVRFRDHLIEIRIPNQEPGPRGDMVSILHQIATQAHARAAQTLT
ncbi:hypothetical protein DPM19_00425 [Actinomadura craniellae]|uniref:DUF5642 domain-containing protein n=1 Tax=Actinomadura craniellae TaxID=2231787 RepID=A0A365HC67_9ACTN|nr:hypothetical protein DPM19_00425 [Actinomadura craniellae]